MGTQEERDWLEVANGLLIKCGIDLRVTKLTECDATVFVSLYEAILGEKVPDYTTPSCQEDDVHNVQSVIDSLALDFLHISLSHITGENIVRGDKESVKNLLEIFDGLLEYLTDQVSEEEALNDEHPDHDTHRSASLSVKEEQENPAQQHEIQTLLEEPSQASSVQSSVLSSKYSLPCWSADGSESTAELIRLGDFAQTFADVRAEWTNGIQQTGVRQVRAEDPTSLPQPSAQPESAAPNASLLREPLCSAIPLQPPYQTTTHRATPGNKEEEEDKEEEAHVVTCADGHSSNLVTDAQLTNGIHSPPLSPVPSEGSVHGQQKSDSEVEREQPATSSSGPRRVLFRTQPDVLLLTQESRTGQSGEDAEGEESEVEHSLRQRSQRRQRDGARPGEKLLQVQKKPEDVLSWHKQKNRETVQELHLMSVKLSQRLEELDLMLKIALGETEHTSEPQDEDKHSHHSDSIMECHRTQTDPLLTVKPPCARSLSLSPPQADHSLGSQLEDPESNEQQHLQQNQRRNNKIVDKYYEMELQRLENIERAAIEKERERARAVEREYRKAILKDIPCTPKASCVTTPKTSKVQPSTPSRARHQTQKCAPLKVKEGNLLSLVLEEFPQLQLSPQTLSQLWKQQRRQVDQLTVPHNQQKHKKLLNQVEEAQRRHDLLTEIIHKEQEHNHRLRDFRERIRQQRYAQNQLREQRQQVARAKKFHSEYHVQMRARMMRARTREERMLRQLFEEGLELQKSRLREQRAYAKEQRLEQQRQHRDELASLENYYKDQFSLLAEALAQERQEIQMQKKAQEKVLQKMKRELRSKMEREIGELQKLIVQSDEDTFFRELDVEGLRRRVHMASFQYSTSHLP